MKQPCKDCPFKKSVEYGLSPQKARDILQAITHDRAFHCHETVDYSEFIKNRVTAESELCFGAVLFSENDEIHILVNCDFYHLVFSLASHLKTKKHISINQEFPKKFFKKQKDKRSIPFACFC